MVRPGLVAFVIVAASTAPASAEKWGSLVKSIIEHLAVHMAVDKAEKAIEHAINGEKVTLNLSSDQLKKMIEEKFSNCVIRAKLLDDQSLKSLALPGTSDVREREAFQRDCGSLLGR